MRISDWSSDVCSSDLIVEQSVDLRGRLADREAGRDRDRGQHALEPLARSLPMRRKLGRDDRRCGMRLGAGVARDEAADPFDLLGLEAAADRKSDVAGKSVSLRGDLGGCRLIKKQTTNRNSHIHTTSQT